MGYILVNGNYTDNKGNKVISPEGLVEVFVAFEGKNNTLTIKSGSKLKKNKNSFS